MDRSSALWAMIRLGSGQGIEVRARTVAKVWARAMTRA